MIGWSGTRGELWNAAERAERRRDSVTARECLLTLFAELDEQTNFELACSFAGYLHAAFGVAVDVSLHSAEVGPHAHLLFTTRQVSNSGEFGKRTCLDERKGRGPAAIQEMREVWCNMLNAALLAAGLNAVDHRGREKRLAIDSLAPRVAVAANSPCDASCADTEMLRRR